MKRVFGLVLVMGCSSSGDDRAPAAPGTEVSETERHGETEVAAGPETTEALVTLDAHQWKHRVLLIFAPHDNDALREHRKRWSAVEGTVERDMVRIEVVGDVVWRDGERRGDADALRNRFTPEPRAELTVVLIGKDGGEKMRGPRLAPADVFSTIDAMPMRQREMRERHRKPGTASSSR